MARRILYLLVFLGGAFLLGACNLPEPEESHTCASNELVPPVITSPGSYSIVEQENNAMPPNLVQWTYDADCEPVSFHILFSKNIDFGGEGRFGSTNGSERGWPDPNAEHPQFALYPASEYFVKVRAVGEGDALGPWSSTRVFFTAPYCESSDAALVAPVLLSPEDGAEITDERYATLHYEPPEGGCIPQGYFIDLQTDSSFGGTNLLGQFDRPGTYLITDELDDCATYYWRVAAIYNGVQGPFSETRSFSIHVSQDLACMPPGLAPMTPAPVYTICPSIDSLVAPTLTAPDSHAYIDPADLDTSHTDFMKWTYEGNCLPGGYRIELSTDRDFRTSTMIDTDDTSYPAALPDVNLQPGTEYWWRVAARLGDETGPFSDFRAFLFGATCGAGTPLNPPQAVYPENGESIPSLPVALHYEPPPGQNCLPNGYFLDVQTTPAFNETTSFTDIPVPLTTLMLMEGDVENCTMYYWHVQQFVGDERSDFSETRAFYINLGGLCPPAPPVAFAHLNLNCRAGPGKSYDAISNMMAGQTIPLLGRDDTGTWFLVANPTGGRGQCWISNYAIDIFGNINTLEIVAAPPLSPTPTTIACNKKLNRQQCEAAGGTWKESASAAPYCECP